jgi:hypothetical protein
LKEEERFGSMSDWTQRRAAMLDRRLHKNTKEVKMRQISFVLMIPLILFCGPAFGQSAGQPQLPPGAKLYWTSPAPQKLIGPPPPANFSNAQKFRYYTIQWYLTFPSPLQLGDQLLANMGDEAAADLLMILGASPALSGAQMLTAMDIVHKSFMDPRAIKDVAMIQNAATIQNVANRKPTSSLALLQKFQASAVDEAVKERIAIETNFVNAVPQTLPPLTLQGNSGPPSNCYSVRMRYELCGCVYRLQLAVR